jgi:thiol:disulfide interchange protein DsbD
MRPLRILALLLAVLPRLAVAAESAAVVSPRDTATLVSATDAVAAGGKLQVGLRLRMAPGWHTYWRNPGDAGIPAELAFTLPPGVAAGPVEWPAPQRLPEGPVMTFGYTGDLLLPVTLSGATGALPVKLHATWLICANICVPEQGDFVLELAAGTPAPSAEAPLFAAVAARLPRPLPWQAHVAPDGVLSVAGDGLSPANVAEAFFFPNDFGQIEHGAAQTLAVHDGWFGLTLQPAAGFKPAAGLTGVLAVTDRGGQPNFFAVTATPGPAPAVPVALALWRVLGFAFLGGLILNLMPCVFPVLAMKAIGLARLSGAERGHARAHALSYTAGVLLAFAALGLTLSLLRAAGAGWGFQFQSPAFVVGLAWLLFAVGLNLSGVFEVGGRLAGAGQSVAGRGGHFGSFATGLLAVLVATPCTAPFMGAAIAAALAAPVATGLAVFLAMGLGLAAPYLLLAGLPGLARLLPRPGAWMEVLRQALAFPMYAASAWLLWVMSQESGPEGVLAAAVGFVLLGFAGWALGLSQRSEGKGRRLARAVALAAGLATLAVLGGIAGGSNGPAPARAAEGVEPFSAARLAALRRAGRPVFVDMTAAWCVTCLVNDRVALAAPAVRAAFAARNVVFLRGDWTRQDPEITAFLRANGRDGVPLYVFYPGGERPPSLLPQLLTEPMVLHALEQGAG